MKKYRFQGMPDQYRYEFEPEPGKIYPANIQCYHRHTLGELLENAPESFKKDWQEVEE